MSYRPEYPSDINTEFLWRELQRISQEFENSEKFVVLHNEPDKPRRGDVRYADGSDWNPGYGEGLYIYSGEWLPASSGFLVSVRNYGAVGDGVTDDTAAIQAAITAMTARSSLYFPTGRYLISANLTKSSVNHLSFFGDAATIYENGASLTGMLHLTSCDYVQIEGLAFEATEDNTYFQANTPSQVRAGLRLTTCDYASVQDIRGKNKRTLFYADTCLYLRLSGYTHEGFCADVSGGAVSNANYLFAVDLVGCDRSTVSSGVVTNHGSAVLLQSNAENVAISNISGEDLHDNGVYISSGLDCSVSNCSFKNLIGDGVKARGSGHSAVGVAVENAARGIVMTGLNGGSVDAQGATGAGSLVASCTARNCSVGIDIDDVSGDYIRSIAVTGNVIIGSTETASLVAGGVRVYTQSNSVSVTGNMVTDFASDLGIEVRGVDTSNRVTNVVCSDNVISRGTGSAASTRGGIRVIYADNVSVSGNVFDTIASGIGVRINDCTEGSVVGNVYDGGQVVRIPTGESVTGFVVSGNRGSTILVDGDNNVIGQNYATVTGYPAASTTPLTVGQITVASGEAYIATGVASSSDWQQITP